MQLRFHYIYIGYLLQKRYLNEVLIVVDILWATLGSDGQQREE